jgi:hypothetical protein
MKLILLTVIALAVSPIILGQAKSARRRAAVADRDELGMNCVQILDMSSSDWIARFRDMAKDDESGKPKTLRAIAVYGKCYDARTDRLVASLGKTVEVPLRGTRGNFRDFEQALGNFTVKALAADDPPADALKTAYALFYEKQFRYEFYQSEETKPAKSPEPVSNASTTAAPSRDIPVPAPSSGRSSVPNPVAVTPDDANPVTMAKNHFGELLGALPEDEEHQLHSAFGDIVGRSQMTEATRLEIYRYAIFLLEPISATPFAPPPF